MAPAVPVVTLMTSVAAKVIPRVKKVVLLAVIGTAERSTLVVEVAAPALQIHTVAVADEVVVLATAKVLTTVEVLAGTVYSAVTDVVALACPRIFGEKAI